MNFDLEVQRPKVIWKQIAEQIRSKILKKEWPPGTKLPATADLAAQSGADVKTIHHALTELVKEGLITRARKVGTYVTERKEKLSTIGIYHASNIHLQPHAQFLQALDSKIQNRAAALGISTRTWVDTRPKEQQTTPLPEMEKAAKEREIEGVISSLGDPQHTAWMQKFPVPVTFVASKNQHCVTWSEENLLETALGSLREQGSKSVGIIVSFHLAHIDFFKHFHEKSKALGLKTAPEWVIAPGDDTIDESCHETFGYQAFNQLWSQKKKPDGLLVYPDGLARGVIMAMMAHQVRVPEDLRVVLHKNEEVKLFCPLPVTFIVSSVDEAAVALLKNLAALYRGKQPPPEPLNFKIVAHTGES